MTKPLTSRQEAEAAEQFGDDLAALNIAFTKLCERMSPWALDRINGLVMDGLDLPDLSSSDVIGAVAEAFRKIGGGMSAECDEAAEAEDRRRDSPLSPDHRRLGQ